MVIIQVFDKSDISQFASFSKSAQAAQQPTELGFCAQRGQKPSMQELQRRQTARMMTQGLKRSRGHRLAEMKGSGKTRSSTSSLQVNHFRSFNLHYNVLLHSIASALHRGEW